MELLIESVDVNAKNLANLTAMDIFHLQQNSHNQEAGKVLRRAKAKRAYEIIIPPFTFAEKLISWRSSLIELRDKYLGILGQSQKDSPNDVRNVILVVSILIATATYQASLNPPGGYWQDDKQKNITTTSNDSSQVQNSHRPGEMILQGSDLIIFFISNSLAFSLSILTILIVIIGLPFSKILY